MIRYTPQHQLTLNLFSHPFEEDLDSENRWVKLASVVPWDYLAAVYCKKLRTDSGRLSVDARHVIAALIVKHKLKLDDRGTIEMVKENIYLQYFCGLRQFTTKKLFDPSLFVDIRKRLGGKEFDEFNRLVIEKSEEIKPHQSRVKKQSEKDGTGDSSQEKNKGTLKVDATVADQEISYPNDLKLLNTSRENLERIVDILVENMPGENKPRLYRRVARRDYLKLAKKKRKPKKELRKGIKQQLQYISRDLKILEVILSKHTNPLILETKDMKLINVIKQVYEQQKTMYDTKKHSCKNRIVNIHQPHVRPIVRGKDKNKTEFGSKINVSEVGGFCRIDKLSWDAFNESTNMKQQVENYKDVYGRYPKLVLADQIYLNRENRKYLKERNIDIIGKPLGRPPKQENISPAQKYRKKKQAAKRNHVEGKFGQGKRGYGLNNIKARLPETSESWVNAIFFVMNLVELLKLSNNSTNIFVLIFKSFENWIKKIYAHFYTNTITQNQTNYSFAL